MGTALWSEDEERLHKTHPGCMSGILHVLDYNVKKILPQRKHDLLIKHAKRNRRRGRFSNDQDSFEVLKLLDGETSHVLVDQSTKRPSSTHKRSLKARVKALVSEEIFKDTYRKQGPWLQRTYSIHHLESDEWVRPIVFLPENVSNEELKEKAIDTPVSSNKPSQNAANHGTKDYVGVSDKKAKLIKSGSFPVAYRPTKLQHKLNDFYSLSRNSGSLMAELDKNGGKNSDDDLNNGNSMRFRRISSLDEFSNRYTQLFDYTANKELKLHSSRSLKLTNESENSSSPRSIRSFTRIRSLPHLDNPSQESCEPHSLKSASQYERIPVAIPLGSQKSMELGSTEGSGCLNGMMDGNDISSKNEYSVSPLVGLSKVGKENSCNDFEEDDKENSCNDIEEDDHHKAPDLSNQLNPVPTPECCSQEEKSLLEFKISEGAGSLTVSEDNLENKTNTVNASKLTESSTEHNHNDENDDFTYVRKILEQSGFIKNGFRQTWYSSNQPIDPLLFQALESQSPHDPEFFEDELIELSHHLLLFDLVNEVFLKMHQRSYAYYPKGLSFASSLRRPVAAGNRLLEVVWKSVSRLRNMKPDMNKSLDSVVFCDLVDDGWMNLQLESECVALELGDLIFDEVLVEVLGC